jgi:glycosyltransferase involved in cell wall biosynthesis
MKKTILFIHQSFPGQFVHLSKKLAQEGHRVAALTLTPQGQVEGVSQVRYSLVRAPQKNLPHLLRETDTKILRGESAALAMRKLRDQDFKPDVVYAHPGWGEAMFVKDIWPETRLVVYAEWFYNALGQEVNFDPEFPPLSEENQLRLRLKNTTFLHALNDADLAIAPTQWQKSRFPAWAQKKIQVVHEGLDLARITLGTPKAVHIPGQSTSLKYGDPIVTFVARHLEPVRGFHVFMRALPHILRKRPDAHIFILGKDAGAKGNGYGGNNPLGKSWRQSLQDEVGKSVDLKRVHFMGQVDYKAYLAVLRLSACHVYLTTPFILSWSFLEAAALGLPIIASRTAPVQEFSHLEGVELVDFFDHAALSSKVLDVLDQPVLRTPNALEDLDLSATLQRLTDLLVNPSSPDSEKRSGATDKKSTASTRKPRKPVSKTAKAPKIAKATKTAKSKKSQSASVADKK